MRWLLALALAVLGCDLPQAPPRPPSMEPVDAGTPTDAGLQADAGANAEPSLDASVSFEAGQRLIVGMGAGQLVSWPVDPATLAVGEALVLELSAPLSSVVRRPGTSLLYAATLSPDGGASRVTVVQVSADGGLTVRSTASLGAANATRLNFDEGGTWLTFSTGGAFRTAKVNPDDSVGASRQVYACDAIATFDTGEGLLASCGYDDKLMRFDVSADAGPTNPRLQAALTGLRPTTLLPWGEDVLVHGSLQNGVPSSQNRAIVVSPTGTGPLSRVDVKPPSISPMATPYATAAAKHPTLEVAYLVNGGSSSYGGNNLGVVGSTSNDGLEVRQTLDLPNDNSPSARAAAVSADGRWLLVGNGVISEVRAWPIDPSTGQLGTGRVVVLADDAIFIDVR